MTDTTLHSSARGVDAPAGQADDISLMPQSRAARVAVWLVLVTVALLVFSAWLRPNMVFDLADMVFCN